MASVRLTRCPLALFVMKVASRVALIFGDLISDQSQETFFHSLDPLARYIGSVTRFCCDATGKLLPLCCRGFRG